MIPSKFNSDIEKLRAMAILMVLFNHSYPFATTDGSWYNWLQKYVNGWGGVDLFFVVSGYVISMTLVDQIDSTFRPREPSAKGVLFAFWMRRIFRLLPTLIIWELFTVVGSSIFNSSGAFGRLSDNLFDLGSVLSLTRNIGYGLGIPAQPLGSYWSLSLEDQFYLLLPLFLLLVRRNSARVALLLLVVAAQAFVTRIVWSPLWHVRTDALAWGVLLFFFSRTEIYQAIQPKILGNKWIASSVLALLLAVLVRVPRLLEGRFYTAGLIGVLSLILVWIATYDRNYTFPFFDRALKYIGGRSYGLYVIHAPAFYLCKEVWFRIAMSKGQSLDASYANPLLITCFGITFILSEVNFRLVEQPLRERGRRIAEQIRNRYSSTLEAVCDSDVPNQKNSGFEWSL